MVPSRKLILNFVHPKLEDVYNKVFITFKTNKQFEKNPAIKGFIYLTVYQLWGVDMKRKSSSVMLCLMLVISIFIGAVNFAPSAKGEQGAPHDDGIFPDFAAGDNIWTTSADWWIEPGNNIFHENKTILMMGNLYVNGSLTLTNVTLQMGNTTYDGEYNITVLENGNLTIQDFDDDLSTTSDASIIESTTAFRFGFQAYPGSQFEMKNSELYDCGWSTSPFVDGIGLFIYTDWAKVTGNYINDSYFGIVIWESNNVTIANNTINGIEDRGVYTDGAEYCYIQNNTLTNIPNVAIHIYNSIFMNVSYNNVINNPNAYGISLANGGGHDVYNNTLDNNDIGVFVHADGTLYSTSYSYIFENEISNSVRGIHVQGLDAVSAVNNIYIFDNEIYSNTEYGIILYGDNGPLAVNNTYIFDNKVYNNGGGGGHGIRFIGNSLGDVGLVYCLDNEVRDNNIAADTTSGYFLDSVSGIFILGDYIARNDRNLWVDSSDNVYVTNTSLEKSSDPGDVDIRIEDNSGNPPSVYFLNTTFNKGSAIVLDTGSFLNVRWYLHVRVMQLGSGADNVKVWVNNSFGNPDPLSGQPFNTSIGNEGWIRWLRVTEFIRTSTSLTYYTPHHIYAEKGNANSSADPNMNLSKEVIINLNSPPTVDNISTTSATVPREQEINITANATDPEDSEDILTAYFEYSDPNVIDWNTTYLGTPIYIGTAPSGYWQVSFIPPGNAPLGIYKFRVRFEDPNGSSSSWLTNLFVVVQGNPPIADAGPDGTISAGTTYDFDGSGSTDDEGIVNYTWNFTYDSTDIYLYDINPQFTFITPGVYIVTLRVEDAQTEWDTDTVQITVIDDINPIADAGSDDSVKVNTPYIFDASGSWDNVGIIWYNWTFDDGSYDNGTNITPQHIYTSLGIYTVTLKCFDAAGNWAIDTITINVIPSDPPIAEAGPDNSTNEDSPIVFNGSLSTDDFGIVSYYWDVDVSDGLDWVTPDLVGMEVIWIYDTPGDYIVTLRVIDGDGGFDEDILNVTVYDITPPIANAGSSATIDEDTPYQFDGTLSTDNSGFIALYNWDFGDGNNSIGTDPRPFHTYAQPDIYTVTLNVSDAVGNWALGTVTITVVDITPPTANAGPDNITNEYASVFVDGSASYDNYYSTGALSYSWDMDASDGIDWGTPDRTGVTAILAYSTPNALGYIVTLNVTDPMGNSGYDTLTIIVLDITPPTANAGPNGSVNEDSPYDFDGSGSTDNVGIFTYAWDVDASDGVDWSSPDYTVVKPSHIYSEPGVYLVTLNVTDAAGYWSTDTVVINVTDITPPIASAGPKDYDTVYNGTLYAFNGSLSTDNSGYIAYYNWSFGDGSFTNGTNPKPDHTYVKPGIYVVTLTVTDVAGNSNSDTITIKVIDTSDPNANAGPNATVDEDTPHIFDGSNSFDDVGIQNYAWDIDASDGIDWSNPDFSGSSLWDPVHTYTLPGFYTVTLNVTDADGNWNIDTVFITVKDVTPPMANAGSPAIIDEDTPYMLDGSGSYDPEGGTITWYNWTFGDGTFLNGFDPLPFHTYLQPGSYSVTLNVTDAEGNWALNITQIQVLDVTPPIANAGPNATVNEKLPYTFDGSGSFDNVDIAFYAWDMDKSDGVNWNNPDYIAPSLWDPSHTYTEPGTYTVTLRVNDTSGNWDIDEVIITVVDVTPPTANAGPDETLNEDTPYTFDSSGSSDNVGIATYYWDIDASDGLDWITPDYIVASPMHIYSQPGIYTVTLRVTDAAGNWALNTTVITVLDVTSPTADAGLNDVVDEDKPYIFNASASTDNVGIVNYSWDMDDSDGIDWGNPDHTGLFPAHIFTEPGTYIVTLRTSDAQGNFATDTMVIEVNDVTKPILNVEFEKTIDEDVEYEYNASLSSDNTGITTYHFSFGDGSSLSGNEAIVKYTYTNPGAYVVMVNITDKAGNWFSGSWLVSVRDITPPLNPDGLSISKIKTGGALNISWSPNTEEDLNHYKLYFSTDGINFVILDNETSPERLYHVHYGLLNGRNYSYYIVAVDDSGLSSQPSNVVSAVPDKDTDGDGEFDAEDEDDDNDGVLDNVDAFPYNSNEWSDTDGNGVGDNTDEDDDGDGVIDVNDDLPFDPTETLDTDGDGIGNNADTDDDNDGKADVSDDYPLDPEKWKEPFDLGTILFILLALIAIVVAIILGVLLFKQRRMNTQLMQRVDQLEQAQIEAKQLQVTPSATRPPPPRIHRPPRIIEKPPKPPVAPPPPPPQEAVSETPSTDLTFEALEEGEEPTQIPPPQEPEGEQKPKKEVKKPEPPPPPE